MKMIERTRVIDHITLVSLLIGFIFTACQQPVEKSSNNKFPDGTEISAWFSDSTKIDAKTLGKWYSIADFGAVADDTTLNTEIIQKVIDEASANGGGVVVIPKGTFRSGALFFKPGTHLHLEEGAMLKGSNDITKYPKQASRMEGQNLDYFPALVNAYGVDNFSITGTGTIDGNGKEFWKAFWQRRKENRKCTNLEVSRPRLVFIWDCDSIQIQDVKLQNSGFWTTHLYKCNYAKILDAHIFAPKAPIPAPSTDAIDVDACTNVHIKGCYMSVNDDALALKGGKGPWADEDPNNGPNFNVIMEDCTFGWCHSVITCGSESIHTKNVIMRNCVIEGASRLIFLKMRPDTPQKYEFLTIENVKGSARTCIYIRPWKQFFDLKGRKTAPVSISQNITFKNIEMECKKFAEVGITEHDRLANFTLENMTIKADNVELDETLFDGLTVKNVMINDKPFSEY